MFLSFAREQTDGVGVDGTESFTDFASSSSDDTPQISHSIAKSQFAYMNPGYSGDKGEKVGQLAAVFVNPDDEFTSFWYVEFWTSFLDQQETYFCILYTGVLDIDIYHVLNKPKRSVISFCMVLWAFYYA